MGSSFLTVVNIIGSMKSTFNTFPMARSLLKATMGSSPVQESEPQDSSAMLPQSQGILALNVGQLDTELGQCFLGIDELRLLKGASKAR